MANWLERARREIPKIPDQDTANTAERNLMAVTAVTKPGKSGFSRASIDSNRSDPAAGFREIKAANDGTLPDPAAEARRQRVLEMLAQRPGTRYAVVTDCEAEPDAVIMALAIRGVGTCELRIPKAKYDGVLLLDLIERHGATVH